MKHFILTILFISIILGVGCSKETKNDKSKPTPPSSSLSTTTIKGLLKYSNGTYTVIKDFRTHLKKPYPISLKSIPENMRNKFKTLVGKEVVVEVQLRNGQIVKVLDIEKYLPNLVPSIVEGLVEVYNNKDVYIVERWKSRSRISYKVTNMREKIASYKGKVIKVKGKIRRYNPFSAEIHVDRILSVK